MVPDAKRRENVKITTVSIITERARKMRKQGKIIWAVKKSLVRTDLNGFHRVLGMKVRFKRLKSKGVVNKWEKQVRGDNGT